MIAMYRIEVDGRVVSGTGDARLIELVVSDEVGVNADTVEIALDDSDKVVEFPKRGVRVEVMMGMGRLVEMGVYYVDGVEVRENPCEIIVRGCAAPFVTGKAMQNRRSESYDGLSLGGLARVIAGRYGMKAIVCDSAEDAETGHVDQMCESDLGFLNRVANGLGYVVKPCAGGLLVGEKFSGRSASGRDLTRRVIDRWEVSSWSANVSDRGVYGSVTAEYRDLKSGGVKEITVGGGEPELRLPHTYASKQSAKRGAETRMRNIRFDSGVSVDVSMAGDEGIFSGMPVEIRGFRGGVDGFYYVKRVVHRISRSGYVTEFNACAAYSEGDV